MAEANVFSPCSSLHHRHSVSVFPSKLDYKSAPVSSAIGFPSSLKLRPIALRSSSNSDFHGRRFVVQGRQAIPTRGNYQLLNLQMSIGIGKAQKWWEKGVQTNMKEIKGAQDFVDSLLNAGDKLVVVDFFSPGCGGCKALHPKICQLAEMNPDVQFLQVNYEEHKSMCYTLNVHVLPFFRFYRGALGRVCSFSCTNATIKKFKDALAKHSPDRCSLGPPKGLEEKELIALASNKDLGFRYTPKPEQPMPAHTHEKIMAEEAVEAATLASSSKSELPLPLPLPLSPTATERIPQDSQEKTLVSSGR